LLGGACQRTASRSTCRRARRPRQQWRPRPRTDERARKKKNTLRAGNVWELGTTEAHTSELPGVTEESSERLRHPGGEKNNAGAHLVQHARLHPAPVLNRHFVHQVEQLVWSIKICAKNGLAGREEAFVLQSVGRAWKARSLLVGRWLGVILA